MLLCGAGAVLASGAAQAQTAAPPASQTVSVAPPAAETPVAADQAVAAAPTLRFWDGGDPARHGNGAIDGGSGTWSAIAPNWTDAGGAINGPMQPVPAFAVFQGTAGTVTIDDSQGVPAISSMLFGTGGYRLTGGQFRLDGGAFTSIRTGDGLTARIDSELTGESGLLYNALGTLILGGNNSYTGGTRVDGGTLIGDTRSIRGDLANGGSVVFDQAFDDTFRGEVGGLSSLWGLMTKRGAGTLTLGGGNQLDWRVEQGGLIARAEGFGGNIDVSSGARVTLSSGEVAGVTSTYRYALSGAGRFDVAGKALLTLTANSGGFAGHTEVRDAALRVEGSLGGTLQVGDGGRLGGTGRVGDVSVGTGGRLIGTPGEFLTMSSLALGSGAIIDARLGTPATPQFFQVEGDLTLDGTINIAGTGPIGAGVYRLINFGGKLTNNGLKVGTLPTGQERSLVSISTTIPWAVDLISEIGGMPMQFWDGSDPTRFNDGRIEGGPGVWRSNIAGWTDRTGKKNQAYVGTGFSVFDGRGGQVVIDGAVQTGGMQFAVTGYALSGSGLRLAGSERTVIRVGDGSEWASTITAEISAPISGTGRLTKSDAGTLILSGVNNYAGATEVEAGTLVGNTGSIRNTLLNAGTIVFDQRANGTFADKVLGLRGQAGKMIKRGSGVLTLARESRLDWTVEEGRLVAQADRYLSDLTTLTGGELALGVTTGAVDFDTEFRGNGRLTKTGAGKLVLTEHSRLFEGTTRIAGGELVVDRTLGGQVIVEANSRLSGEGELGSVFVARGGTIAPQPSAARPAVGPVTSLRIDGDITFEPGARFEVDVDPASPFGFADNLYVRGVARLAGSVFHVGTGGNYAPSSTYTILTAFGGIEGRFDGVSSSFAFLTPRLEYTPMTVQLILDRNDVQFSDVAVSANQRAVGTALQAVVAGPLYDAVIAADAVQARAAFDSISGDFHASLRTALVEDSRLTRGAALSRLRAPAGAPGISAWGEAIGSWGHYASDGNAARLERSAAGGLAGIEARVPEGSVRLGVFGGYHHSDLRGAGDADVDSYQTGLYAGAQFGGLALRGGVAIGWQDVATRREISGGGLEEQVRARYGATTAQAFGELAWRVALGGAAIEPFAGLAHVALDVERGRERGEAGALALGHDTMATTYATLGVRGETLLGGAVSLRGSAAWQHVFGDRVPTVAMTVDGARFESVGLGIAQDGFVGDIGIVARLGEQVEVDLSYRGALSQRNRDHGASAGLTFRF
ncbi:autotransporter domain-containing protein [Sphingomonas sp. DG1-23]|uniref:autotransporter domain-containing protein n=1 Tax=Sphingomonas sp. DG1-23 TaxID=3068316 RepID=UPI00273DFECF|nr:autotransporter domain-containing protein [Sphingomonas sp. DG1-23]MDP5280047.1 autotransporter domain-containing protein [Sphingomonas sp. DG1-23]